MFSFSHQAILLMFVFVFILGLLFESFRRYRERQCWKKQHQVKVPETLTVDLPLTEKEQVITNDVYDKVNAVSPPIEICNNIKGEHNDFIILYVLPSPAQYLPAQVLHQHLQALHLVYIAKHKLFVCAIEECVPGGFYITSALEPGVLPESNADENVYMGLCFILDQKNNDAIKYYQKMLCVINTLCEQLPLALYNQQRQLCQQKDLQAIEESLQVIKKSANKREWHSSHE